jgi:HEAT repeats
MEREKLESMLIDYIDGNLGEAEVKLIEAELAQNEEARKLQGELTEVMEKMNNASQLIPGGALKNSFEQFLEREIAKKTEAKTVVMFPMFYRVAASIALLMVVGVAAYWIHKDQQNQERIAEIEKELEANKRVMMAMLENDLSASQRMQGVSVAFEMAKPDDEIVNVLIKTMNYDPNTNVRLAALDALGKFSNDKDVRKALIESLSTQKDPVIQIALIQQMVKMKEKTVIKQLERMTKDVKNLKAVKDEAYSGIFKLS